MSCASRLGTSWCPSTLFRCCKCIHGLFLLEIRIYLCVLSSGRTRTQRDSRTRCGRSRQRGVHLNIQTDYVNICSGATPCPHPRTACQLIKGSNNNTVSNSVKDIMNSCIRAYPRVGTSPPRFTEQERMSDTTQRVSASFHMSHAQPANAKTICPRHLSCGHTP